MTKIDFPFIVGLKFSFQTDDKLFLIMDYLSGGELFFHLRKQVNYMTLEPMHLSAHRDLKK